MRGVRETKQAVTDLAERMRVTYQHAFAMAERADLDLYDDRGEPAPLYEVIDLAEERMARRSP